MNTLYDSPDGAVFSGDRLHRYVLWRAIEREMLDTREPYGTCNFIMLNPSTADELKMDPTVTRCYLFAKAWGFARLVVTNLFALRSTDPKALYRAADPIGKENDGHILDCARDASLVICAWGNHGTYQNRAHRVAEMLREAKIRPRALKVNVKSGQPTHPLYLNKNLSPMELTI